MLSSGCHLANGLSLHLPAVFFIVAGSQFALTSADIRKLPDSARRSLFFFSKRLLDSNGRAVLPRCLGGSSIFDENGASKGDDPVLAESCRELELGS